MLLPAATCWSTCFNQRGVRAVTESSWSTNTAPPEMFNLVFVLALVLVSAGSVGGGQCQCAPAGGLCGVSRERRVVGGARARLQDLPWTALVVYKTGTGRTRRCGGTLINDRYVLTSAACVDQANTIDVYLGR